jgi:hypothetical protein
MQRTYAKMSSAELLTWRWRYGLTAREAAVELRERTLTRLLPGRQGISLTLARLAVALERIAQLEHKLYDPPRDVTAAERKRLESAITS